MKTVKPFSPPYVFWISTILVAAILLISVHLVVSAYDRDDLTSYARHILARGVEVADESQNIVTKVNNIKPESCSNGFLDEIRYLAFTSVFVSDIGYTQEHQLKCTAMRGRLPEPVAMSAPDSVTRYGQRIWTLFSGIVDPRISADMMESENVLIFPTPAAFRDIYVPIRFFVIWILFTLILIFGRQILQRWFNENWMRHQDNLLLISRLETLANQDPLTETANRRAMEVHLDMAINRKFSFSLIMLDVDYFKRYNDHYGHQAGDECLVKMAKVLKSAVRTPDDMVARYGGEEFLLLLPGASAKDAELVAERVQKMLMQQAIPHLQSEVSGFVTVSIGIASSGDNKNVTKVISAADSALYRAKSQGRNRWCL